MKIFGISILPLIPFFCTYIYKIFFFSSLSFLRFLIFRGSEPLVGDSQPDDFRAPDEKTSHMLKDLGKQDHKTKGVILFFSPF